MAGYGEQKYGSDDTYNKPVRGQTDEYGNPTQKHSTGEHGATGTDGQHTTGLSSKLNRSGSNSSSSSEDDGVGGRRKKGVVEKIKEKLPGQKQEEEKYNSSTGVGTGGGGYGTGTKTGGEHGSTGIGGYGNEETREQKGMMDKIKEKLPGQKN